jgi:glycosyltransferase involved in cell wall biosynthesis
VDRIADAKRLLKIDVVIPVCNEVHVIDLVIEQWLEQLESLHPDSRIIIEDANSNDGTVDKLKEWSSKENISVRFRSDRDGFSKALLRLFGVSQNDWVFVADSDGQYVVTDFEHFVTHAIDGAQFIKGVKVNRRDGFLRRAFSFVFNRYISIFMNVPPYDYNSSHYLISRNLLDNVLLSGPIFRSQINVEVALRALLSNSRFQIVYVKHNKRVHGISRENAPRKFLINGFITMRDVWKLKTNF